MPSSQARSPPSLTKLPPEIILQIFEYAPDFSVVNSLARTARALQSTYVVGSSAIFHAVASRIRPDLPFAEQLVDAQEAAYDASPPLSGDQQNAPSRNQRLLSNARCAAAASNTFAADCKIHLFTRSRGEENAAFRPSERARFRKSVYQLWTLCTIANTPSLRPSALEYLDMRNPIEIAGLHEVTTWARCYNGNKLGDLALDVRTSTWWDAGSDMVNEYCDWDPEEKSEHRRIHGLNDEAPSKPWVFFDHAQKHRKQIETYWRIRLS